MLDEDRDSTPDTSASHDVARIGWSLVALQFILIIILIAVPWRRSLGDLWPPDASGVLGFLLGIAGLGVVLSGLVSLGGALTPTPVPLTDARLRTEGPYRVVRHPIYSGILVAGLGFVLLVGSWWSLAAWIALLGFFIGKSLWEDRLLADVHGVAWYEYAHRVGGLVPRPASLRR